MRVKAASARTVGFLLIVVPHGCSNSAEDPNAVSAASKDTIVVTQPLSAVIPETGIDATGSLQPPTVRLIRQGKTAVGVPWEVEKAMLMDGMSPDLGVAW